MTQGISTAVSLPSSGKLLKVTSFLTTSAWWALTFVSGPLMPLPSPETTHCIPPRRSASKTSTAWMLYSTGKGRLREGIIVKCRVFPALCKTYLSPGISTIRRDEHANISVGKLRANITCNKSKGQKFLCEHRIFSRKTKVLGLTSAFLLFFILYLSENNTTVRCQDSFTRVVQTWNRYQFESWHWWETELPAYFPNKLHCS